MNAFEAMEAVLYMREAMTGDCDDCGHSIIYHVPLVGCMKCDCDEFC